MDAKAFGAHQPLPAPDGGLDELLGKVREVAQSNVINMPGAMDQPTIGERVLTRSQLRDLPKATPLVDGVINHGNLVVVAGNPGCGKTYWVLDLLASMTTGEHWMGHKTYMGPERKALYIAGEGVATLNPRLAAWEDYHTKVIPDTLVTLPEAAPLGASYGAAADIANYVRDNNVGVLVVDTLSRAMAGVDENSAQDMSRFIRHVDMIKTAMGPEGVVIVVHHNNKSGTMRGSSALLGAVDVAYTVTNDDGHIIIECEKRKDGRGGQRHEVHLATWNDDAILRDAEVAQMGEGNKLVTMMGEITASLPATATKLQAMTGLGDVEFPRLLQKAVDAGDVVRSTQRSNTVYDLA